MLVVVVSVQILRVVVAAASRPSTGIIREPSLKVLNSNIRLKVREYPLSFSAQTTTITIRNIDL